MKMWFDTNVLSARPLSLMYFRWTSKEPSNAGAGTKLRLLSCPHHHYVLREEPGSRDFEQHY
jgi:hypothetical protein